MEGDQFHGAPWLYSGFNGPEWPDCWTYINRDTYLSSAKLDEAFFSYHSMQFVFFLLFCSKRFLIRRKQADGKNASRKEHVFNSLRTIPSPDDFPAPLLFRRRVLPLKPRAKRMSFPFPGEMTSAVQPVYGMISRAIPERHRDFRDIDRDPMKGIFID